MTQPITTNTTPVKTNAYVQAEGGVNNYTNARRLNLGATLAEKSTKMEHTLTLKLVMVLLLKQERK